MVLKRLFSKAPAPAPTLWSLPKGQRAYAIGDIHGRLDLLDRLLAMIAADDAARGASETTLIFLGDLADRGPDSRGVIERLMDIETLSDGTVFLAGNHEELLIRVWDGERPMASTFNRAGGKETLMSYGITADTYDAWDLDEMTAQTSRLVPADHIAFLRRFKNWHQMGDYIFVHAGIRPGIHIEDQDVIDLRWIRGEFVRSVANHGAMIIHGHTITADVDEQPNRIGIDTGAYESGILTAIGLEGTDRWYLKSQQASASADSS
jgi:serine/threonine protein phosphatase 1